ncbi:hypothetical protein JD969_11305 [Planctomycetota bacterium]|nr:hypothetical protein JD969_11305 [Planctomycetota bacterium]
MEIASDLMSSEVIGNQVIDAIHTIHYSTGSGLPVQVYDGIVQSVLREKGFELTENGLLDGHKIYHVQEQIALVMLSQPNIDSAMKVQLKQHISENKLAFGILFNFAASNPTDGMVRVD